MQCFLTRKIPNKFVTTTSCILGDFLSFSEKNSPFVKKYLTACKVSSSQNFLSYPANKQTVFLQRCKPDTAIYGPITKYAIAILYDEICADEMSLFSTQNTLKRISFSISQLPIWIIKCSWAYLPFSRKRESTGKYLNAQGQKIQHLFS